MTCRYEACGKSIMFGRGPSGKAIPVGLLLVLRLAIAVEETNTVSPELAARLTGSNAANTRLYESTAIGYDYSDPRMYQAAHDDPVMAAAIAAQAIAANCTSCHEGIPRNECPGSKRACGHHCNCLWSQDVCDWCPAHVNDDGDVVVPK